MGNSTPGNSDSQRPPIALDEAAVFPPGGEPSDDTPTIISKNAQASEKAVSAGSLAGSLRGRRLAHFELIEPIGVGGMAAVIRARDTQLDRNVALKILPPEMAQDPENVRRFHQEARAAAKLDHENVARVFYCGEDQRLHFIAFEFVEGMNLRNLLERRGRLPVGEAVRYALQVAVGLEHAAARGVVHRDVKPSNIIITPGGRAKLVDMGLARTMERRAEDLTQSGVTLGTFDYISPEQALEPRDADARSDIYSLGCTLYHMLTGQPPVPEGTAAKKLHHHQHVAPLDPRLVDPDIPDELALILGRMMRKDPKDRYQRPVQLVQDLLRIAKQVGAADDAPEGMMFVDTMVPVTLRRRPLVLFAVAAAALGAVVLLVSLVPPEKPEPITNPRVAAIEPTAVDPIPAQPTPVRAKAVGDTVIKTPAALQAALLSATLGEVVVDARTIDMGGKGLVFHGNRDLLVRSLDSTKPTTVRFDFGSLATPTGLSIDGGEGTITFEGIRFELSGHAVPGQALALVNVLGNGRARFDDCSFVQVDIPPIVYSARPLDRIPVASILVEAGKGGVPDVNLRRCYFTHAALEREIQLDDRGPPVPGAQVAIAVNGPARVRANDCAFGPHDAFVHLRSECRLGKTKTKTSVELQHCSGFVVNGPVVRADEKAEAELQVQHCLFSRPENLPVRMYSEPGLIRQADETARLVYRGDGNCYHFLGALWVKADITRAALAEQFQKELALTQPAGVDKNSKVLEKLTPTPWAAKQPLRVEPPEAFRPYQSFSQFGLKESLWGRMEPVSDPVETVPDLGPNLKVVDAAGKGINVFKDLAAALASAADGDEILLKTGPESRALEVASLELRPRVRNLTIRPYPEHQPVLVLDPAVKDKSAAFFRLAEGNLVLDHLHFVLEPEREGFTSRSIVQIGDSAGCVFQDCVVTLKSPRNGIRTVPLSVATVIDPDRFIKVGPVSSRALLRMNHCFVRGDGDLVSLAGSPSLDVNLDNTLLALTGSLLDVQGGDKEAAGEGVRVQLRNVSAFCADAVFALRSGAGGKGLSRTAIEAQDCLFAPLADRPLVYLNVPDQTSEDSVRKYIDWKAGVRNWYANLNLIVQQPRGMSEIAPAMLETVRWKELFPEPDSRYERLVFPAQTAELLRTLWDARPDAFAPATESSTPFAFGARPDFNSLLQPPARAE